MSKKEHDALTAEKIQEEERGDGAAVAEEKNDGGLKISVIFALLCGGAALYTQHAFAAVFCFGVYLVLRYDKLPPIFEKHGAKIFIAASALIVAMSIAVRIFMYAKCRSLWLDEALLAHSILAKSWKDLLASPLSNGQSAPVLYVITVKAINSVFGYSEFSLRVFSFLSFLGLLLCEWLLLKKVLKIDSIKTALVLIITAVLPSFVYYSNELKPYMSDAFFVVLTLLLYAFYTQNKISLIKLTVFYVLILGFCSPAVFFIGGILATEFLSAVFAKDKKHVLYVVISGLSVVALFGLYYYWWMLPIQKSMDGYWNSSSDKSQFNAFFIVLVISLYFLYTLHSQKKLSILTLTVLNTPILLLCPPTMVFVGGILAGEFLAAIFAWNKKRIVSISASLLSTAAVFGLYYAVRTSFVADALTDFWGNPNGKTGFITAIKNIFLAFNINNSLVWALVPFALLGIYSLIKQKNKTAYSTVLSMFFVCLASSIGKWPLNGRLWLFLPAIVVIFSSVGFDLISKSNNIAIKRVVFCLFLAITIYYSNFCLKTFSDKSDDITIFQPETDIELNSVLRFRNTHVYTQEVNPLIRYVEEHIKNDEILYVYPTATLAVKFKLGYTSGKIGQTDKDNVIYGNNGGEWNESKLGTELYTIIKSQKAYLLFQHYWHGIGPGIDILQEYGSVTPVLISYDTPLFYFEAGK